MIKIRATINKTENEQWCLENIFKIYEQLARMQKKNNGVKTQVTTKIKKKILGDDPS